MLKYLVGFGILLCTAAPLHGDVPKIVNHQGVVSVDGVRFDGAGDFRFAIVDTDAPIVLWSNDGSITGASAGIPTDAVSLTVTDGVYSVLLGDTSMTNMTDEIAPSVFADDNAVLRIWFDDGDNGIQQFTPDHPLTTNPYSFRLPSLTTDAIGSTIVTPAADGGGRLFLERPPSMPASGRWHLWADSLNNFKIHRTGEAVPPLVIHADTNFVGIGTTTPEQKLDVNGQIQAHFALRLTPLNGNTGIAMQNGGPNTGWSIESQSDGVLRFFNISPFQSVFGFQSNGDFHAAGSLFFNNGALCCSDKRFKKDVRRLENSLDRIVAMRGVNYRWKQEEYPDRHFGSESQVGFIGQEMKEILPEAVRTDDQGFLAVDYGRITPVLVEAVKEMHGMIEEKDCQIAEQRSEIQALSVRLAHLEALVGSLTQMEWRD